MRRESAPIAGDTLRRLSMQRTLQHISDIHNGRVRYIKPGAANPAVHRHVAAQHEERIFQTISTLKG